MNNTIEEMARQFLNSSTAFMKKQKSTNLLFGASVAIIWYALNWMNQKIDKQYDRICELEHLHEEF